MDLASYCVQAVLVEGRSVRAVAAATGRSKSWVHRHGALYRAGGDEALVPKKRGPKVPANLTSFGSRTRSWPGANAWPKTASTPAPGLSLGT